MITRVPVVSVDGKPLMPTTPTNARKMIKDGIAKSRRNKLGLFYVQMLRPVGTETQPVALAVDPGAKYDGVAVASHKQVELKAMVFLPDDVPKKMEARRNLRRARRYRNTPRRPKRFDNRKKKGYWLAPTQRSKVEARLKVIRELCGIYPIRLIVTEDVHYNHYRFRDGKYFSTVEVGKTLTYWECRKLAALRLVEVSDTDAWREKFGLPKFTVRKWEQVPETHANDAVAMLMGVTGCEDNPEAPFFVWRCLRYVRRSLHRQHFQKGSVRPRFGGTTNGGFFRKGDWVEAEKAGKVYRGWVCGLPTETTKLVGVADADGRRIGQFSPKKVGLLARSTGFSWREVKPAFLPINSGESCGRYLESNIVETPAIQKVWEKYDQEINEVKDAYRVVMNMVENMRSTEKMVKYLDFLGFDTSYLYKPKKVAVDAKKLFPCKERA